MVNPYAATVDVSDAFGFGDDAEQLRRMYLKHEASIKSLGLLYMLPGVLLSMMGVVALVTLPFMLLGGNGNAGVGISTIAMFAYGILGGLQLYTGWGLRRFRRIARGIAIVFSSIGLLMVPFGTLFNAYFLYLLLGEKGKMVFSDVYQDAIKQTPHIKYRTPIAVWILVGVLILFLVFGVVGLVIGA